MATSQTTALDARAVDRALKRMADEIVELNSGTDGFSKCSGPFRGDTTILVARVKSQTGGGLPKPAVIRGKAGGAAGVFILFAAAVAASTIACGLVRQSIPAQVRSPGL